jgi:hypothetical protein
MTLSGLASEWVGFEQKAYWLNSEKILDLRLTEVHAKEETPTTVGAIFETGRGRKS